MKYSISHIAQIIDGKLLKNNAHHTSVTHVLTDSRQLSDADSTLFFALKSNKNDGAKYIKTLYELGVRNFVVNIDYQVDENIDVNFIGVENTLVALQQLAAYHRHQFQYPVIGITGSNGKTVIKEWLFQLMHKDKNIVRSPRSYNSQIGVPLSVFQMTTQHELAIFEAGISQPDEMLSLKNIINPSIGILTHIGTAHDEGFANQEEKIKEKLLLFSDVEVLVVNEDNIQIDQLLTSKDIRRVITWSLHHPTANLFVSSIEKQANSTQITGLYSQQTLEINIPFTDNASIENAIYCWLLMLHLGYQQADIKQRMQNLHAITMRLELNEGIHQCTIINDSYNSDIQSLSIALDVLNQQNQHAKKTVILSDILQGHKDKKQLYQSVAQLLKKKNIHNLIGIGEDLYHFSYLFEAKNTFYRSTADFLQQHPFNLFNNEAILLKGARVFTFEKINQRLQQKDHETVMEIDLSALIHNYNLYKQKLNPGVKIMTMVKAFSYGSGSYEVSNALQFHRADYLAVAYADEGVALREAGITLPIMVMNTEKHSFESILNAQLEPEIYNFRSLHLLIAACDRLLYNTSNSVKIHIKLDTGMKRLGFLQEEIPQLIQEIQSDKRLKVASIFSHLAASDATEKDDFTENQIQSFKEMVDDFESAFNYPILKHILNSAGITRFPEAQFDMVRLGISLYGIASDKEMETSLKHVSRLRSSISQIKSVKKGESVGYDRKFIATKDIEIATIAIGYADGLSRGLSNGKGFLMCKNQRCPIIGNICMDMCMIDVTNMDAKEGDIVWVFNEKYPVTEIAKQLNTIPYEILTGISRRVKRMYFQE